MKARIGVAVAVGFGVLTGGLLGGLDCARPVPAAGGHLLLVGGDDQGELLVKRFIALAGGKGRARIVVIPTASAEPEATGLEKVVELKGLGAEAAVLMLTRAQAEADSTARRFDRVTGVWFTGGDQARVTPVLLGTPTLGAIQGVYDRGGVIGGTSAGAALQADSMITGNQYREGVDTAGYYGDEFPTIGRHAVEIQPGLGFLHGAIVDQHFIARERHNRLLSVILERPSLIGVGIDQNTALEVEPNGRWQVVGVSSVVIYDARNAQVTPPGAPILGATGVRVSVLPNGSEYDPRSGAATLPRD